MSSASSMRCAWSVSSGRCSTSRRSRTDAMADDRDPSALRVLMVEDDVHDAELILDGLRNDGLQVEWRLVDDEAGYVESLDSFAADVVISDLSMPGFSGYRALEILREKGAGIPFIFV